jgi:tellurite methyltransferase
MTANKTVDFFDSQFQRQAQQGAFALNPFEERVLPLLRGRVLDFGCGLGNLALEAARRGCSVMALDGSAAAIQRIRDAAQAARLSVEAEQAELAHYRVQGDFDAVVAIGLLMFFPQARAEEMLADIMERVRPGGIAAVNVLIEGTTYLDMFEPGHYYLFGRTELDTRFADWARIESRHEGFDAPGGTRKEFATVIARKP